MENSLGNIVRLYLKTKTKQNHASMLLEQGKISSNNNFLMEEVMPGDSVICIS